MNQLVEDYLYHIGERNGLEEVVVQLLEKMGLEVYSVPQIGVRQYGVDVAAVGRLPDDEVERVHLITIKAGDICRKNWNAGSPEDVRPSLDEIEDGYLKQRIRPQDKGKPISIHICCGGRVLQELDGDVWPHARDLEGRHLDVGLKVDNWNGSGLSRWIVKYLLDEKIFISADQRLLKRCLAIIEEEDLFSKYYWELLKSVLKEKTTRGKSMPVLEKADCARNILLCLGILVGQAIELKHLEGVYLALERTVVYLWQYLSLGALKPKVAKCPWRQMLCALSIYDRVANLYFENMRKVSADSYLFALASGGNEVDVNLKFYHVLSRLSEYGMFLLKYYEVVCKVLSDGEDKGLKKAYESRIKGIADCVCGLIQNNTVANQPLLDYNHYAISITAIFLRCVGREQFAHGWFLSILRTIDVRFLRKRGFPVGSLSYEELLDHVEGSLENDKRSQVLKSGEFYAMLCLVSTVFDWQDVYDEVVKIVKAHIPRMNHQLWYMNEGDERGLCYQNEVAGRQLCDLPIEDKKLFLAIVKREGENGRANATIGRSIVMQSFFFVACRLNGVPIPADVWCVSGEASNGEIKS